ncbi:serine hydrolase [Patulibacter sp.]|uniref:serine hydrolase n=1 Tax=Patulibacter sp. TaxID=1912859 RepID=UPI00271B5912|nr:serine hydrolase [Patulibacter sp.]MDO9407016.1 serine hydrolase [Patulibacter sp.]
MDTADRIRKAFDAHGVRGSLHAIDLDARAEVAVGADRPMPLASVFKVALATAVWRAADRGELDLTERVEVGPRSGGPTGLGAMLDPAAVSVRDLGYLALALSDNGAADLLVDRLGLAAVQDVHDALGMRTTAARHACRDFSRTILEDTGTEDAAAAAAVLVADEERFRELRVRDAGQTNGGSARDQTRLLRALWQDEAAAPASCAAVRRLMGLQVWPHRIASGFADDAVLVAGKTGTLPGVRNEVGVVEGPGGLRVAIAVFLLAPTPAASMPHLDALIGTTARTAYDDLARRAADDGR